MATGMLVLFCVAILNFGISNCELKLEHVVVTYRSGEHTPCDFAGGPRITNVSESDSKLTDKGVNGAYDLGQKLGDHYKTNFSLDKWTHEHYYSMGTSAPRCLMSAFNFGAGLEKNNSAKVKDWDETEKQRVIDENVTFPHTDQYLRFLNMSKCPGFYSALQGKLTKLKQELNKYSDKLENVTGRYSSITTNQPCTVWLGYEIFLSQNESNPDDTNWLYPDNWDGLCGYSQDYIFGVESEDDLKKLSGGIMVDSILNVTELIINGSTPQGRGKGKTSSHKMSVLAVSQAPLAAMLGAFTPQGTKYNGSVFDAKNFYPRNGAHHVVEIYKNGESRGAGRSRGSSSSSSSSYKVRVMYAPGGENDKLNPLIYPDCENDGMCPYDKLKNFLEKTRLPGGEQDKLCNPPQTPK